MMIAQTVTIHLPKPYPVQRDILRQAARYNVLACGRRWGKSTIGKRKLIKPALAGFPVAYFFPTYKMMTELWRDVVLRCEPLIKLKSEQEHRLELITGGVIDMWSLTDPNAARGRKYKAALIDEAAMEDDLERALQGVIRPTLADYRGELWALSSPKGHNYFEQMFLWGQDPTLPDWASWQRPTHDNPYIHPDELLSLERELPPLYYAQEILAQFVDIASNAAFLESMILWDACRVELPGLRRNEPMVLAMDAGISSDTFSIVGVTGMPGQRGKLAVRYVQQWIPQNGVKLDFDPIEEQIELICKQFAVTKLVYDPYQLHQMGTRLMTKGIVFTEAFNQGPRREHADKGLLDLILARRLLHDGNEALRQAAANADRRITGDSVQEKKLRIVKRSQSLKIDPLIAAGMACDEALKLGLDQ
jgi:hypothetical protein